MTTTQQDTATITAAAPASGVSALTARFEVTTLPVSDVDRAKAFYQRLGWRLDIDFNPTPDTRAVQFTPPGSHASTSSARAPATPPARCRACSSSSTTSRPRAPT
jgi:hypothetical protein